MRWVTGVGQVMDTATVTLSNRDSLVILKHKNWVAQASRLRYSLTVESGLFEHEGIWNRLFERLPSHTLLGKKIRQEFSQIILDELDSLKPMVAAAHQHKVLNVDWIYERRFGIVEADVKRFRQALEQIVATGHQTIFDARRQVLAR